MLSYQWWWEWPPRLRPLDNYMVVIDTNVTRQNTFLLLILWNILPNRLVAIDVPNKVINYQKGTIQNEKPPQNSNWFSRNSGLLVIYSWKHQAAEMIAFWRLGFNIYKIAGDGQSIGKEYKNLIKVQQKKPNHIEKVCKHIGKSLMNLAMPNDDVTGILSYYTLLIK